MSRLTEADLAAIRARAKAIDPGEWPFAHFDGRRLSFAIMNDELTFVRYAASDVWVLLAEVDRLQAREQALMEALREIASEEPGS